MLRKSLSPSDLDNSNKHILSQIANNGIVTLVKKEFTRRQWNKLYTLFIDLKEPAPEVEDKSIYQKKCPTDYKDSTNVHFAVHMGKQPISKQIEQMFSSFKALNANYKDKDRKREKELQKDLTYKQKQAASVDATWALVEIDKSKTSIGRLFDFSFFNQWDLEQVELQEAFDKMEERPQVEFMRKLLLKMKRVKTLDRKGNTKLRQFAAQFAQYYKASDIGKIGRKTKQYHMPWRQEEF